MLDGQRHHQHEVGRSEHGIWPPTFYAFAGAIGRVYLDDVRNTHDAHAVGQISRFVAINSAVEVDLFGQVNSERSDGTIQAGAGGLPSFAHGSQLAASGRLLICLGATARGGQVSRIVPALGAGSLCTVPRHLADAVVTEFGVAELRGLSLAARAEQSSIRSFRASMPARRAAVEPVRRRAPRLNPDDLQR